MTAIDEVVGKVLGTSTFSPYVDICYTGNDLIVMADIPGVDENDLDIKLIGDTLVLKGERKNDRGEHEQEGSGEFLKTERRFGGFSRSLKLPCDIQAESVQAVYKDGVLSLRLPKVEGCRRNAVNITLH